MTILIVGKKSFRETTSQLVGNLQVVHTTHKGIEFNRQHYDDVSAVIMEGKGIHVGHAYNSRSLSLPTGETLLDYVGDVRRNIQDSPILILTERDPPAHLNNGLRKRAGVYASTVNIETEREDAQSKINSFLTLAGLLTPTPESHSQ
jgi:hypothetical protein